MTGVKQRFFFSSAVVSLLKNQASRFTNKNV